MTNPFSNQKIFPDIWYVSEAFIEEIKKVQEDNPVLKLKKKIEDRLWKEIKERNKLWMDIF